MAVQAIDAHLRETAILTVVLHPQTRHEIECLCQTDGIHGLHRLRGGDGHQRRCLPPERLLAVRGNRDFIHVQSVMLVVVVRHVLCPRTKGYRPEQYRQGGSEMFVHCSSLLR